MERLKAGGEGDDRDEMVGWHHRLNGHEFEHVSGDSEGQGGLSYTVMLHRHDSATEHQQQLWKEALGTKNLLVQPVMIRNRENTGNPENQTLENSFKRALIFKRLDRENRRFKITFDGDL